MRPKVAVLIPILTSLVLVAFLAGCNKKAAAPKVDLSAQVAILKSGDTDAKVNALVELGKLEEGALPALDDLIALLKDPAPEVRRLSAYVMMQIGPKASRALPALEPLLQDPDRGVVLQVGTTMTKIDKEALKGMPLQKLKDSL